jgi:hypothetical protein
MSYSQEHLQVIGLYYNAQTIYDIRDLTIAYLHGDITYSPSSLYLVDPIDSINDKLIEINKCGILTTGAQQGSSPKKRAYLLGVIKKTHFDEFKLKLEKKGSYVAVPCVNTLNLVKTEGEPEWYWLNDIYVHAATPIIDVFSFIDFDYVMYDFIEIQCIDLRWGHSNELFNAIIETLKEINTTTERPETLDAPIY